LTLQVGCSDPARAGALIGATPIGAADGTEVTADPTGLAVTLPAGTGHEAIAEINRVLVEGGISVHRLQVIQASLESWFLQVTSRLGESQ
jgi:uncharacterized protein YjlB